jgi:hypothetical protein
LVWHGGNAGAGAIGVETKPAVYLVWWGKEWADGFQTADTDGKLFSSKTLQSYLASFFSNIGGSGFANIQTQYCRVILIGSTSCVGGADFIANPKRLRGRLRPVSLSTAATTRRRRASTVSATRSACSTPSSPGRTRTGLGSARPTAGCTT